MSEKAKLLIEMDYEPAPIGWVLLPEVFNMIPKYNNIDYKLNKLIGLNICAWYRKNIDTGLETVASDFVFITKPNTKSTFRPK